MNKIYYLPKFQPGGKTHEISAVRDNTRVAWILENNFTPKMTDYKADPKLLQNIGETILDFTPVIGDIKGLTVDPYRAYKEDGWKGALSMAGLGLIGLVPGVGDVVKKARKATLKATKASKSFKKIPTWRERAIYLRNNDVKREWRNLSEDDVQKRVSNYTEKQKDRHLSRSYEGQYATSPEEQFTRVNNTSQDRVKWIKEHPVKSLPSNTTIEEQIELADRNWANEHLDQFRKALDENVEYSSKKLGKNVFAESEGSILTGPFGNPPEGQIRTIFSKENKSPIAETTLGHEAAIHGSGNLDDEYIYQYLKENGIVDFDKVSPYFKDTDRGEIGAHLSEIPSYLGFKKETPTSKYQTPEGKTKINKDDIINYNRFQRENGINVSQAIIGNIKNWPEFLKFMNGHRFIWTLPLFGVGTAKILNTENYEHNQTGN